LVIVRNLEESEEKMSIEDVIAAISGPSRPPVQPEGGSDVQPLPGHGTSGLGGAQPSPGANVEAQQGAGSTSGGLYPGASGVASDGTIQKGYKGSSYSQGGPQQLSVVPGLGALTAGGNFGANTPAGGAVIPGEPVGRPGHALGRDQSQGQSLNPALGKMPKTPPGQVGPFGEPSAK
jgi:hypothetical protein